MSPLLATALIAHVVFGVTALALINLALMHLIRRAPSFAYLSAVTFSALVLFLGSWLSGGYYYLLYYGTAVKPVILKGAYPFAHEFFMETKEHVFLILAFLALLLFLTTMLLRRIPDERLKRAAASLALLALLIGVYIAGAGIFISGAVRQ